MDYSNDEDVTWDIWADCEKVYIFSKFFDLEPKWDILTINGTVYTGNTAIRQVVDAGFTVQFISDYSVPYPGFILEWECVPNNFTLPRSPGNVLDILKLISLIPNPDILKSTREAALKMLCLKNL